MAELSLYHEGPYAYARVPRHPLYFWLTPWATVRVWHGKHPKRVRRLDGGDGLRIGAHGGVGPLLDYLLESFPDVEPVFRATTSKDDPPSRRT